LNSFPNNASDIFLAQLQLAALDTPYTWNSFKMFKKSIQVAQKSKLPELEAAGFMHAAQAAIEVGAAEACVDCFKRSLHLYKELNANSAMINALMHFGDTCKWLGMVSEALDSYSNAVFINREYGDVLLESMLLFRLGMLLKERGDLKKAQKYLELSVSNNGYVPVFETFQQHIFWQFKVLERHSASSSSNWQACMEKQETTSRR
jgi:tetratricopeptide (TPR) repeat protein